MGFFDFFKGNKNKDLQQDSVENIEITENTEQEENDSCVEVLESTEITENAENTEEITENISSNEISDENTAISENDDLAEDDFDTNDEPLLVETDVDEALENEDLNKNENNEEIIASEIIYNNEPLLQETNEDFSQPEPSNEQEKPKKGFFAKLFEGLGKTRKNILGGIDSVLGAFTSIDEDLFDELEEVLIMADIGVETTMNIIDTLRSRVKKERVTNPADIKNMLVEEIAMIMSVEDTQENLPSPTVMLVIGVNGVGKTTTIGKLASNYKAQGKSVMLAAADTFRAAAIDQLEVWGNRVGVEVIKHEENSDPAAVVYDAVNAAKNKKIDLLICDTAGRLHNKKNLMEELRKISKIIDTQYPKAHKEVYLVLDATTGQNALQQAKLFKEVADISGIVLTKLDGTAKGGIVIAIKNEMDIPVRFIGVGEGVDDLQPFNSSEFAKALFGND